MTRRGVQDQVRSSCGFSVSAGATSLRVVAESQMAFTSRSRAASAASWTLSFHRSRHAFRLAAVVLLVAFVSTAVPVSADVTEPSLVEADASVSAQLAVELTQPCGFSSSFQTSNQCCGDKQCPYANGVCCGSGSHCCPAGAACLPPVPGSNAVRCGVHASAITPSGNTAAFSQQPAAPTPSLRDISAPSVPVEVCPCASLPGASRANCPCAAQTAPRVEAEEVKGACAGGKSCNPNDVIQLVEPEIVSRSADTFMKPAQVKAQAPAPIVDAQNGTAHSIGAIFHYYPRMRVVKC